MASSDTGRGASDARTEVGELDHRVTQPAPTVSRTDVEIALGELDAEGDDGDLTISLAAAIEAVCELLGIEAAVDPVEDLAGQIEAATRAVIRRVCDDLADVAPALDPLTVERAMEVTAASRKVAAHVLGQEADR